MRNIRDRLISLTPPAVPLFAVFYDEEAPEKLLISPVIALALVDLPRRGDPGGEIHPLVFNRVYGVDIAWWEDCACSSDVLGFLLQEELPRAAEIFADEIAAKRIERVFPV